MTIKTQKWEEVFWSYQMVILATILYFPTYFVLICHRILLQTTASSFSDVFGCTCPLGEVSKHEFFKPSLLIWRLFSASCSDSEPGRMLSLMDWTQRIRLCNACLGTNPSICSPSLSYPGCYIEFLFTAKNDGSLCHWLSILI